MRSEFFLQISLKFVVHKLVDRILAAIDRILAAIDRILAGVDRILAGVPYFGGAPVGRCHGGFSP